MKEIIKKTFSFSKRWLKEIVIALIFALVAAVVYEYYVDIKASNILKDNLKAVATIETIDKDGIPLSQGSGIFIKPDGILVTNFHVVAGAADILAKLPSGAFYQLKEIRGVDSTRDIAILQFDARENPYVKEIGNSDELIVGESVVAIGSPLGLEKSVSAGIISNPKRIISGAEYIQFTAPISPGSSGGGLFNKEGKIIGITSGSMEEDNSTTQNINFAIPINIVNNTLNGVEHKLTEGSSEYFYWKGKLADNKKEYDSAIEYYNKAVELNSNYKDAYMDLGIAYYNIKNYDLEVESFEKAVELAPDDTDALYFLGTAYEDKGLYDKAITAYNKSLKIKPDEKDSLYQLIILYFVKGEKNKAASLIPELIKLNPGIGNELKVILNKIK